LEEPIFGFAWGEQWDLGKSEVIPWKELGNGVKLSLENAARLISDADLLLGKKRRASALVLLVVAWEEIGKAVLLLVHYKNHEDVGRRAWRKIFKDHQAKQTAIFDNWDIFWHKPDMCDLRIYKKLKGSLRWTKEVMGFYVNWIARRKTWSCPRDKAVPPEVIRYLRFDVGEFLPIITKHVNETLLETRGEE